MSFNIYHSENNITKLKPATVAASAAENLLKARMRLACADIQYTGKYETSRGRRLMLNRQVSFIGVFTELFPGDEVLQGVRLNTVRTPGHYKSSDKRLGSVKRDSRLGLGNEIFYLRCDTIGALEGLVNWYETQ